MYWTFDRIARLEELARKAERLLHRFGREMIDAGRHTPEAALYWARMDVVERRMQRYRLAARAARHNRRYDLARAERTELASHA